MEKIDKDYEVIKNLGQGLAGEVYLVKKGGQLLALKLLKPVIGTLSPQEATAHFKAEFSILKQLSHPHIARIVDFGTDSGTGRHYYTSEYIEGRDLFSETRQAALHELEEFFIQALRALEYLQGHGISHFDIKPENLLVHEAKRTVKLIDFGLAGFRPRGQLAGTPAYMAPEVVLGNKPDGRADLYSLALTFYECATGNNPFRAKGLAETLKRQETLIPAPAHEANPKIPQAFSDLLVQLMMKNPADRPNTAGAALRILSRLAGKKISLETEVTRLSYLPNETKLIGRSGELQAFQKAVEEVLQGSTEENCTRIFFVTGSEGIGKSRLLKEFRFHAQLAGLRTHALEGGETPDLDERICLLADDRTPAEARSLALSALGSTTPVLLVAASSEGPPELEGSATLRLQPFTLQDIRAYLAALTGLAEPSEALARELEKRSQGSPQFLTEILNEVIRHGSLLDEHGRWTAETIEDLGVDFTAARPSEKLEASFAKDFQLLDPPARDLLQWAALTPGGISAETLQEVSEQEDLPFWILELVNRAYLQREEDSQAYRVVNPLLQEWIARGLPESDRQSRHGKLAKILKSFSGQGRDYLYHLGRSGPTAQAREALIELAREQDKQAQFAAALENLREAERLPQENLEKTTEIQLKIGEELISTGDLSQAETHFDAMKERLLKLPDDEASRKLKARALEKLGATYLRWNQLEKAESCFRKGLDLVEKSGGTELSRQLIFENYLGRIQFQKGHPAEALETFSQTREKSRKLGSKDQKLVINNDRGMALLALNRPAEAKTQFEEDLKFFQEIKNEHLQAKTFYNLGEAEYAHKNMDATIKHYKRCVELSKPQKNYEMLLRAYNGLGNVYHLRHDYEESLQFYERALVIAQKTGEVLSQAGIEINLGSILNLTNRPAKAVPHLKMVSTLLEGSGAPGVQKKYFQTNAYLELGDVYRRLMKYPEAQGQLDLAKNLASSDPALLGLIFPIRVTEAKLFFDQGRVEEAIALHAQLEQEAKRDEEKIELAKLANLIQGTPTAAEREPAVTQGAIEYPRPTETTLLQSQIGEGAYAKLLELTRYINAETNLDFVLKSVLQFALELSGAERGLILLVDENDRLETKASINAAVNPNLTEISTRVAEQALQTGEVVETDDALQDARFNEYQSVMILKLRSILCLPIHSRNKTVGVLYLDHRYRPGVFGRARLPLLQAFCDQAGIAIENAKLFERYEKVQAELKSRLHAVQEEAEHYHELLGEATGRLPTRYAYDNIVAKSKPMHEVFKILDKITETNIAVFINGETGTGKELIAKALHYNNPDRAKGRFVAINCGGIPPNLIESELFGYKAGAFTGATRDKKGLFAEADGGTLFMDEIADLDLALQVKLLRALEEGEVIPVGDTRPIRFNVRVVSASHKKLEDLIRGGKFREDLYYRICQIRIPLPPLRERREDIPLLIEKFASEYGKEHGSKKPPKISASLLKRLVEYDWPGNVRELENTIRVASALADKGELTVKNLPENFGVRLGSSEGRREGSSSAAKGGEAFAEEASRVRIDAHNVYDPRLSWEDYEKRIFAKAFAAADFKPLAAANALDVSAATFYKRIKDFDLNNRHNPVFEDSFALASGKTLRQLLEEIFWAAYQASGEKAYTAIKWLGVSQGHFYNVLKAAKKRMS